MHLFLYLCCLDISSNTYIYIFVCKCIVFSLLLYSYLCYVMFIFKGHAAFLDVCNQKISVPSTLLSNVEHAPWESAFGISNPVDGGSFTVILENQKID